MDECAVCNTYRRIYESGNMVMGELSAWGSHVLDLHAEELNGLSAGSVVMRIIDRLNAESDG